MPLSYATFLADPSRQDVFLFEIAAYVRADGSMTTLRLATAAWATEPSESPANTPYLPYVVNGYGFVAPAVAPNTLGFVQEQEGWVMQLTHRFGDLDAWRTLYAFDGRFVTIKHGGYTSDGQRLPYASFQTVKVAQIDRAKFGLNISTLTLREQTKRFDQPVEDRVLWGGSHAGGFDGSTISVSLGAYNGAAAKIAGLTGDVTARCRVYTESLSAAQTILSGGCSTNRPIHLEIATSGQLVFRWSKGGVAKSHTTTTLTALTVKTWHFVAFVVSSTTLTVWIYSRHTNTWDSESVTNADLASRDAQTSGNVYLGATGGSSVYFNGQLDELVLRNDAQSESTIKSQFQRQLVMSTEVTGVTAVKFYAKFDDGTGSTVTDSSDSPANGTISGILTALVSGNATVAAYAASSGKGNSFGHPTTPFGVGGGGFGFAVGDAIVSAGWSASANNGDATVTFIGTREGVNVMEVTDLTLVRDVDGANSGVSLSKYVANAHWYPSMSGLEFENDGNQEPLPNAFGKIEGWAPPLVDPIRGIYQLNATQIEALDAVRLGGDSTAIPIGSGSPYTDLLTFLNATTEAGEYDWLNYAGGAFLRLGSPGETTLPITVDLQGDKLGGTYVSTVGTIFRRIVTTRGNQPIADPSEIDTTSFSALETDSAGVVGIVIESGETILSASNRLLETAGAVAKFDRATAKLEVYQFKGSLTGGGTAVDTLTQNDVVHGTEPEPLDVGDVIYWHEIPYRKCWSVLGTDALSPEVKGTDYYRFVQSEFRYASAQDVSVLTIHPNAVKLAAQVGLYVTIAAAQTEADRRLALWREEPQPFKVTFRSRAISFDRYDVVYFDYQDFTTANELQQRLGTGAAVKFVILGVEDDIEQARTTLTLWRENAQP